MPTAAKKSLVKSITCEADMSIGPFAKADIDNAKKYLTTQRASKSGKNGQACAFYGTRRGAETGTGPCHGFTANWHRGFDLIATLTHDGKNCNVPSYDISTGDVKGYDPEAVRFFYDWLLNKSPVANIIVDKDLDFAVDNGIIVTGHAPANMVMMAMQMSRHQREFHGKVRGFKWLIENGFNDRIAFLFAFSTTLFPVVAKDQPIEQQMQESIYVNVSGHGVFSNPTNEMVKNFLAGKFVNTKANYSENSTYHGISITYGDKGENFIKTIKAKIAEMRKGPSIEGPRLASPFGSYQTGPATGVQSITKSDFLSHVREATEQLWLTSSK